MNKKGDFAWRYIILFLIAIAVILFVVVWFTELGDSIKQALLGIFDFF